MKGYKVFNPDWTCRGYQFEVGKIFEEDLKPKCCDRGFHFCTKASDCFYYYRFDPNNKVAEVEAVGDVDLNSDDSKCSTNKLHIIREITWQEVLELVNLGKDCTGRCNCGDQNSGNWNSGNYNSGDWNSGNNNSGNYNSGGQNSGNHNSGNCNSSNNNSGDWNSGNWNSGSWNSGNCNGGSCNSGNYNGGNCNSGNYNSGNYNGGSRNSGNYNGGNYNSGDWNSGNNNSGNYNSGCWNSGNYNIGDHNIGNHNIGNYNAGDWNKTLNAVGCFNTEKPKLKFFDKETDMTLEQWLDSGARYLMDQIDFILTGWIYSYDMTAEEKAEHPEHETTGGYLKIRDKTECCTEWWNGLLENEKNIIKEIPNFDADKFYQITGIRV